MKTSDKALKFGQVPDGELLACRYWEYARESRTLRRLLESAGDYDVPAVREVAEKFKIILPFALPRVERKNGKTINHPALGAKIQTPWRKLRSAERAYLAKCFPLRLTPKGSRARVRPGGWSNASEEDFHHLATATRERWDRPRDEIVMNLGKRPDCLKPFSWKRRFGDGLSVAPRWLETLAFTIDWWHPNDELTAAFKKWLTQSRPPEFVNDRKGQKVLSIRKDLERLATLREIHANSKTADGVRNKEAEKALRCFHALFPVLKDLQEMPLSRGP